MPTANEVIHIASINSNDLTLLNTQPFAMCPQFIQIGLPLRSKALFDGRLFSRALTKWWCDTIFNSCTVTLWWSKRQGSHFNNMSVQGSAIGRGDSNSSNGTQTWSRSLTSYTFDKVDANTDFKGTRPYCNLIICFHILKLGIFLDVAIFHDSLTLESTCSQKITSFPLLEQFKWVIKRTGFLLHRVSQNEQTNVIWSNRFISGFSTWNHSSHLCAAM